MNRRAFVTSTVAVLFVPGLLEAQSPRKIPRVGVIVPVEPESPTEPNLAAFRQTLRDLGYTEGQNITVEYRYAHGKAELYDEQASELVRLKVDIMVVGSWQPALAAKKATQTIPIVGVAMGRRRQSAYPRDLDAPRPPVDFGGRGAPLAPDHPDAPDGSTSARPPRELGPRGEGGAML